MAAGCCRRGAGVAPSRTRLDNGMQLTALNAAADAEDVRESKVSLATSVQYMYI